MGITRFRHRAAPGRVEETPAVTASPAPEVLDRAAR
jgi:hypothetical protein